MGMHTPKHSYIRKSTNSFWRVFVQFPFGGSGGIRSERRERNSGRSRVSHERSGLHGVWSAKHGNPREKKTQPKRLGLAEAVGYVAKEESVIAAKAASATNEWVGTKCGVQSTGIPAKRKPSRKGWDWRKRWES